LFILDENINQTSSSTLFSNKHTSSEKPQLFMIIMFSKINYRRQSMAMCQSHRKWKQKH